MLLVLRLHIITLWLALRVREPQGYAGLTMLTDDIRLPFLVLAKREA